MIARLNDTESDFLKRRVRSYTSAVFWFVLFLMIILAAIVVSGIDQDGRRPWSLTSGFVGLIVASVGFIIRWHVIGRNRGKVTFNAVYTPIYNSRRKPEVIAMTLTCDDGEVIEVTRPHFMDQTVFHSIQDGDKLHLTATPDRRFFFSAQRL